MSRENVEIVRRAYEAWNRGDVDAAVERFDPDVEYRLPPNFPESGVLRGLEQVRQGAAAFRENWEAVEAEVEELIDAGDRVVALVRFRGRGRFESVLVRGSSVDGAVWTFREGRVVSVDMHSGAHSALEAAGLAHRDP